MASAMTGNNRSMAPTSSDTPGPGDERIADRASELLPEERTAGSADPEAQAAAILEESDERSLDRDASPSTHLEHRTSEDTTEPVD